MFGMNLCVCDSVLVSEKGACGEEGCLCWLKGLSRGKGDRRKPLGWEQNQDLELGGRVCCWLCVAALTFGFTTTLAI